MCKNRVIALTTLTGLMLGACAHQMIEGTQIPATDNNKAIVAVLNQIRDAMEARDATGVLANVSPKYFEDNGNSDPTDDYGYIELRDHILPESLKVAQEVHLTFEIHDIVVEQKKAHADIRYASRAKLGLPSGTLWDTHREFNRIELVRAEDSWLVVSGL